MTLVVNLVSSGVARPEIYWGTKCLFLGE